MNKKLLFVANPHSGRAEVKHYALDIIDIFIKSGYDVTVRTTQNSGDARRYVTAEGEGYDRIVACGGDGTVNEVLNGLLTLEKRPELGIIPAGTTNDYAYSLSIPSNMLKAAEIASGSRTALIDTGCFNGRSFTYIAGFGLFTDVTYETPQESKNILGSIAYVLEGAKRISAINSYHIRLKCDSGIIEDDYIVGLFSNTVSIAGMRTAFEDAKLDDGLLEVTLIKLPKTLADIQSIINLLLNIEQMRDVQCDFLTVLTTRNVHLLSADDIAWTIDGENGGHHSEAYIENHHHSVSVAFDRDFE